MQNLRFFSCRDICDGPPPYTPILQPSESVSEQVGRLIQQELILGEVRQETGIQGIKLDFLNGLRLVIPVGKWHVRISDTDSEEIYLDEEVSETKLISWEKYFMPWKIEIFKDGERVFSYFLNLTGQYVAISFMNCALGDTLAFLPYMKRFRQVYHCDLICQVREPWKEFAGYAYPEITFVDNIPPDCYAVYHLGPCIGNIYGNPVDTRLEPLQMGMAGQLGLEGLSKMSQYYPREKRKIQEPYVCIAVQASSVSKGWHYPFGWDIIVHRLKQVGYRVLCIDKYFMQEQKAYRVRCPENAENFTGDHSLIERADLLYYADFFIGVSSGLAWLANTVGCPVILISGITEVWNEFPDAYRVINRRVCHACYNDTRVRFLGELHCPYYHGTEREFECSKKITPMQVLRKIHQLMEFELPRNNH